MYAQVGKFRVSWIISTVQLTRFLRNALFFQKPKCAMRGIGVSKIWRLKKLFQVLLLQYSKSRFSKIGQLLVLWDVVLSMAKWLNLSKIGRLHWENTVRRNVSMAFSTSQMPKNLVKSRVEDEWFDKFLAWVMWKNQYSHFRSHSIHIVKNYNYADLTIFFENYVKLL